MDNILYKIGNYIFNTKLAQVEGPKGDIHELTSIPFFLLSFLVENNQQLSNKRELIAKVWGHEVSDSSINKTVSELRAVFGDSAKDSKYIVTRRKLGYRLIADIKPIESLDSV